MSAYTGRNPMADAVRRAIHTTIEKPPSAGQHIQAIVSIAGEQELRLDTHGSGNRRDWGGHIYLHDQVGRIAPAHGSTPGTSCPSSRNRRQRTVDTGQVTMVRAHGSDAVDHVHDMAAIWPWDHWVGGGTTVNPGPAFSSP